MDLEGTLEDASDGENHWTLLDALVAASEHETAAMEACLLAERRGGEADPETLEAHLADAEEHLQRALEDVRLARETAGPSAGTDGGIER